MQFTHHPDATTATDCFTRCDTESIRMDSVSQRGCGVWGVGCGVWGVGCGVWVDSVVD
eukprot:COSAG03_NODE_67_length_15062_cov_86.408781_8_plen_58_part_00